MRRAVALLSGLAALLAMAASADDRSLRLDADRLGQCLSGDGAPADCIGLITADCQQDPGGQTTVGTAACNDREAAAWDRLLNQYYKSLTPLAKDAGAGEALKVAQRAWIAFRDADCTFASDRWGGGSMRQVAGSWCLLERTAMRTIELRGYLAP